MSWATTSVLSATCLTTMAPRSRFFTAQTAVYAGLEGQEISTIACHAGGCYSHELRGKHKCFKDAMFRDCSICFEPTFASRSPLSVLRCGHVLHRQCWETCDVAGFHKCPMCQAPWR
ncbi:TPA: hypothetical protein N0F65_003177 [Lagenidium giganteum]|uniref:RING-type domain-containing protein n=1 Tax=Lagenidium giganteum TaxID=4803 RepID=A0AAV2ZBY9_9STRA|nr:TPA: hypothetical protein N0F65_003177 [Lagenidium giganteum]